MANKQIPVACRTNNFNGTSQNIWLAALTSVLASGLKEGTDALREADRLTLRIANRMWAGPLEGRYNSSNVIDDTQDSMAAALTKYDELMALQDRELLKQQEALEAAAQGKLKVLDENQG